MKISKRILSFILMLGMLTSALPAAAESPNRDGKISNDYMSFCFNGDTGGFSVETAEGHPQKILDNNIPLLYAEDKERSNGTSFVTVRIDGNDYIFGQDYSFLGLGSSLGMPVVDSGGRHISIPWTVEDVTVTMEAALSENENSNTTGNVGFSFTVDNNSGKEKEVSIRLLLDTALGDRIDAPYFVVGDEQKATLTETEFGRKELASIDQIRCVDSLSNPTKLSYIMMYGFSTDVQTPNKVILGHWANLANTRYKYTPDEYCDFSNYSNSYRVPDSAAAIYWEDFTLGTDEENKSFTGELLYGVGSFSRGTDCPVGINITAGRVELKEVKDASGATTKSYVYRDTEGENTKGFDVTVTIDNTLDDSVELSNVYVNISADEGKLEIPEEYKKQGPFPLKKGETKDFKFKIKAVEQNDLTAGTFYVTLSGSTTASDGETTDFETAAERSVILPSVGNVSAIQMNKINPQTVYTDGDKVVTISGEMSAVESLLADNAKAELVLWSKTANHTVTIPGNKIAFIDDTFETLSFSTDETLYVGEYSVMFKIYDETLKAQLGADTVACKEKLNVSADEKYRIKSYGLIALVRSTKSSTTTYDFYSFDYESEFLEFFNGEKSAKGWINKENLKYDFRENASAIVYNEVLLTVRGKLDQGVDTNGNPYWQAEYANSDIIINNMLSYEGEKPLKISVDKDKKTYTVEGDGLIKVIDSINVWRYSWNISVDTGSVYTLDSERLLEKVVGNALQENTSAPTLKFGGAASLIQTIGGFAVSLKYGELSSEWHPDTNKDGSAGSVTYGIGFGGKISLPIKAKKSSDDSTTGGTTGGTSGGATGGTGTEPNVMTGKAYANASDEFSESDPYDAIANMFGAAEAQEYFENHQNDEDAGISGNMGSSNTVGEALKSVYGTDVAEKTSTGDVQKKDEELPEGKLSAEVDNVLFGEKYSDKDKKVSGTGFVGIDATFGLELPKDVLGSFVSNAPGISASVTINTIDNVYEVEAGLSLKIIECEGVLAFKQVNVKNKDVILPDKIEFYIRDGLRIPIAAPVLFMTGLGGGVNGLADTIGGEFDELPPITLLLYTKLEAISVLEGEFNAKISLEELTLTGNMQLTYAGMEKFMKMDAGIHARWIEPWELSLYGNVNIIDGLIKGGITVTIADDYFYGYVFASLCIPDSIPLVGGKTLRGVEAAVSHEFIGANITIIGIKFGVKYYYGDKVSFGTNIDLSPPTRSSENGTALANDTSSPYAIGYYGTNIHALPTTLATITSNDEYYTVTEKIETATGKNALLLEVPYEGEAPKSTDIELYNPDGDLITVSAEGETANMLIQNRDDGDYIYITVLDSDKIGDGDWYIKYKKDSQFKITSFSVNAVDEIPELDKTETATTLGAFNTSNAANMTVDVGWDYTTTNLAGKTGTIDVYLTEDADILTKIQTSENTGDTLGTNVHHEVISLSQKSATVDIPPALPSGEYYAVVTLTTGEGISLAISGAQAFENPNLPNDIKSVEINYGGNGEIFVKPTDNDEADYTHYIAEIAETDEEGNLIKEAVLENNIGQFEKGKKFTFGKEALLQTGKYYKVGIKTLKEKYESLDGGKTYKTYYYYGSETVWSKPIKMQEIKTPKLTKVKLYENSSSKTEIDTSADEININTKDVIVEYTFDRPVFVEMDLNGGKVYSYGTAEDIKNYQNKTFNGFKTDWKFVLDDLEDGDYIVDFIAFNESKDSVKGSNLENVDGAYFAFTVDTSAPILSLAQSVESTIDGSTMTVGKNTVFAGDDGTYVIEGITEKTATLKIDDEVLGENTDGFEIKAAGDFSIKRTLADGKASATHVISAEDKAGNTTEITVSVVRKNGICYSGLKLYANGEEISENEYGEKVVSIRNGQSLALTAHAVVGEEGKEKEFEVSNDELDWSVLYAKNSIAIDNGTVTALSPTETAVKAKLATVSLSTTGDTSAREDGISDYVIINIESNTKQDLIDKIAEAKKLLNDNSGASDESKKTLGAAISSAESITKKGNATEEDYTKAYNSLTGAINAFNPATPTHTSGGSGGGSLVSYGVSAEQTEHGRIELSQTRVPWGNSVTITAVPDDGYIVADMLINGESVGKKTVYTISAVKENITVKVVFAEKSDELPFIDVLVTDWYYDYVKSAYENGYMNGVSETRFEPEALLTRAMFVTVLHRMDGEEQIGENTFDDVAEDAYYKNAVAWASQNGIVNGVTDSKFAPDESITREQMAAILYRYAQYKQMDTTVGEDTNILSYADYAQISEYAVSAMQYTAGAGLIVGKTDTTLNPKDTATRAEAATVFVRFAELAK